MEGRKIGERGILRITEAEFRNRVEDTVCRTASRDPLWGVLRGILRGKTVTMLLAAMADGLSREFFPEEDDDEEIAAIIDRICREAGEEREEEEENHEA